MEIDGNDLRQLLNDTYDAGYEDSLSDAAELALEAAEFAEREPYEPYEPTSDDLESLLELGALIDAEHRRQVDEFVRSMSDEDIRDVVPNAHPEGEDWSHPLVK